MLRKKWKVDFYKNNVLIETPIESKEFWTLKRAEKFAWNTLIKIEEIYCAEIRNNWNSTLRDRIYWNGYQVIYWDEIGGLTREEAKKLYVDNDGNLARKY